MPLPLLPLLGLAAMGLGERHMRQRSQQQQQQQLQQQLQGLMGQGGLNLNPQQQAMFQAANMPGLSPAIQSALTQRLFAGQGLSPSDQLAREKFEWEKRNRERRIVQGADGFNYYADTGERVLPNAQAAAPERKTAKDAAGYLRYLDTQERVFPRVTKPIDDKPSETLKQLREIERLREAGDDASMKAADAIEMKVRFGGKPPEAYVKARGNLELARTSTSTLYNLIRDKKDDLFDFDERAQVHQAHSALVLAFADLQNRGANFTDNEITLIQGMTGGDPLSLMGRTLRSRQSYLDRLQVVGEIIEQRGRGLLDAYISPELPAPQYPWDAAGSGLPAASAPAGASSLPAAGATPTGNFDSLTDAQLVGLLKQKGYDARLR